MEQFALLPSSNQTKSPRASRRLGLMKNWRQRLLVLSTTLALSLSTFALPLARTSANGTGSYTVLVAVDATVTVNGEPAQEGVPYSGDDVIAIDATSEDAEVWVAY